MKPDLGHTLNTGAMTLLGEISPKLSGSYLEGSTNTLGAMMMMAAIEQERGANNALLAIEDMRELFRQAAPIVPPELAEKLQASASSEVEDYLVSTLVAHRSDMQKLLIQLQTQAEEMGPEGLALRRHIWQVLQRDAERNVLALG